MNVFNILTWIPSNERNIASTINTSHDLLTNRAYCDNITAALAKRNGTPVIFEILEDDRQFTAEDIKHLKRLKDNGIEFALDDFRISKAGDWDRLKTLKDVVSYVKLDGSDSLRPYCNMGDVGMNELKKQLQSIFSVAGNDKHIIGEWVQNGDEAEKLFDIGVHAIQGQNFTPNR